MDERKGFEQLRRRFPAEYAELLAAEEAKPVEPTSEGLRKRSPEARALGRLRRRHPRQFRLFAGASE